MSDLDEEEFFECLSDHSSSPRATVDEPPIPDLEYHDSQQDLNNLKHPLADKDNFKIPHINLSNEDYDKGAVAKDAEELEEIDSENEKENVKEGSEDVESVYEDVEKDAAKASELKSEGNEFFKQAQFQEAIGKYSEALMYSPRNEDSEAEKYLLAVLYSNRAACHLHLLDYKNVVRDCTKSLKHDQRYLKALTRRAAAYEKLEELDSAIEDLKAALEIDGNLWEVRKNLQRLEVQLAEKNERLKEEMMSKLKELGNTVLGKFGMSLNNFNAVQDPNTGSYSISYNPNPSKT